MRLAGLALLLAFVLPAAAVAQDEDDPFYLGIEKLEAGDPAAALPLFDQSLRDNPGDTFVESYRARAFLALGQPDEAEVAARAFGEAATDVEQAEYRELLELIAALRETLAPLTPPEPATVEPEPAPPATPEDANASPTEPAPTTGTPRVALVVGLVGGYHLTAQGTAVRNWGLTQLRVDVPFTPFGLGLHLQAGLGIQTRAGYGYGTFPFEIGATWRIGAHPVVVPYIDAYGVVRYADDALSETGVLIPRTGPTVHGGGGGGGGVEFVLTPQRPVSLRVGPEVHVGGAGAFLFEAGLAVRLALLHIKGQN